MQRNLVRVLKPLNLDMSWQNDVVRGVSKEEGRMPLCGS